MPETQKNKKIFSIDIGGSNIKGAVLDATGKLVTPYKRIPTPDPANPKNVLDVIKQLSAGLTFDCVSAGFPGFIKNGVVKTAPNLGTEYWKDINLETALKKTLGKEARVVNDADMLGLGVMKGKGLEIVATLGTGFGTAIFNNGILLPHFEIAHHPISAKGKTYDQYIGQKAYDKVGRKKWNERLQEIIEVLKTVFNYDTLYLGGGNSKKISFELDPNIKVVTNLEGLDGGAKLWKQ